ncbi:response regulator [Cohnella nanjingensis]|uniref:Response regulator n=1 Tax=Cohnella nanjingensis TaxID=1387779 RepID=A0A7X0VG30_9BACL|nr:response regulator [Cohnella nanjingensis]MBB6671903.1 response regulator [Cohnella nanjingensis]
MLPSFCIVDDDAVSTRMLQNIIEDSSFGSVLGTAGGGVTGASLILDTNPDIVLIDLLMADQDGIETIIQLKGRGYPGRFVMISQVENKEMVGQAYRNGIEFFIRKPINWVEVESVLQKVSERWMLDRYLLEIKRSLAQLDPLQPGSAPARKEKNVRDVVGQIMTDLGIVGETGSKDILSIMEWLAENNRGRDFPQLRELYASSVLAANPQTQDLEKGSKAVEQRIRRTVIAALANMASIGLTDYSHPKFEYYAPLYFDFQDIRLKMREIEEDVSPGKGKVNVKKFLQVLYMETLNKLNG